MTDRRSRQFQILETLRSGDKTTADDLARLLHVKKRTIYRDIEDLLQYNIPIYGVTGPEGGYRLRADSPLDPALVKGEEAFRIYLHQLSKGALSESDEDSARTLDQEEQARALLAGKVYYDPTDFYWRDEGSGLVSPVRRALLNSRAIRIRRATEASKGKRHLPEEVVMPLGLVWKAGHWYLVAKSLSNDIFRERLNNLTQIEETDLSFLSPEDFSLEEWWNSDMEDFGKGSHRVAFLADASAAPELRKLNRKSDSKFEELSGGRLRVTLFVDNWRWLIPLLASYGKSVLVEEPMELRAAFRRLFEGAADLYGSDPPANGAEAELEPKGDSRLRSTRGRAAVQD
jgi:predicted DNA-binding transcriptional regulator YafY